MEMNDGKLNIKGEKTWSISYTSTDTSFLFSDFPQGLTLDQSFKVDMKGYITDSLGVVAHFDDHAPNSQHLTLTFKSYTQLKGMRDGKMVKIPPNSLRV